MDLDSAGTLMYWCECSKKDCDYRVEFVNSDPLMTRIFMKYLRSKGIDENRIRARISLHEQDDATECKEYWKKLTSLGDSSFLSPSLRRTSPARSPLPHGTLTIRYNSIELLRRINGDISDLAGELLQL